MTCSQNQQAYTQLWKNGQYRVGGAEFEEFA